MYNLGDLQWGDLILQHGTNPLSRAIECAQGSPYSHAVWVGKSHLYEAVEYISIAPYAKYSKTGCIYRLIQQPSLEQLQAMESFANSKLGQLYGWRDVLKDFDRYVLHVPIHAILNPTYFDCSVFVWAIYNAGGINPTNAPVPSPADLAYSPLFKSSL